MYKEHSIYIGNKNTWDDWHLQPSSRPLVAPPKQKTNYINIPGANGSLDLSEIPQGYPVFENRTGNWEFYVENGFKPWEILYSEIMNYVHGKSLQVVLDDDYGYFYEGRVTVSEWNSDNSGKWSKIKFDYSLKPFKYSVETSARFNPDKKLNGEWLWDPFNFETDSIPEGYFFEVPVTPEDDWIEFDYTKFVGMCPVVPNITVSTVQGTGMIVSFYNSSISDQWITAIFPDGTSRLSDMVFFNKNEQSKTYVRIKGNGTISIDFRKGML